MDQYKLYRKIGYKPHRGQREFHDSPARFRCASCGRRYGKSTMAARDLEPRLFKPDGMFWIVGPTYDLGEKEFRIIWNDLMIGLGLINDPNVKRAYNKKQGQMYIEFPWRTRLEVRSAEKPENLVGESLDGLIVSEAAKHKKVTWEQYLRPALADKNGVATFCTTPEGHNWLYDIFMLGQDDSFPQYDSWKLPSWENTEVFPGGRQDPEILLLERTMSPEWFAQEIGAEFTSFVGKIYAEFDVQTHVKNIDYNPAWQNYVFWDWGFVNPLCALDVMVDPMDNVYIWRERYEPWVRLEDHIKYMKEEREDPPGYRVDCSYGDSADQEAVMTVNTLFGPCIAENDAKTNWRQGVEVVKRFLKTRDTGLLDEYGMPISKPKLFIDPSCKYTIKEFQNYKMKEPPRTGKTDAQEAPVKKDDHAMDALRYGLMHLFELGAKYHLADVVDLRQPEPQAPNTEKMAVSLGGSRSGYFTSGKQF